MRIENKVLQKIRMQLTEYDQIEEENNTCSINIDLLKEIVTELIIAYAKLDFLDGVMENIDKHQPKYDNE